MRYPITTFSQGVSYIVLPAGANPESGGADGETASPSKRKRRGGELNPEATLEPNLETLNVKKFDLAFAVDPLFHKTSAQFDEGGASGLLLNNLSVYRGCEIVFDSMDVPEAALDDSTNALGSQEEQNESIAAAAAERITLDSAKPTIAALSSMTGSERISPTIDDIFRLLAEIPDPQAAERADGFVKRVAASSSEAMDSALQLGDVPLEGTIGHVAAEANPTAASDPFIPDDGFDATQYDFGDYQQDDDYDNDQPADDFEGAGMHGSMVGAGSHYHNHDDAYSLEEDTIHWLMAAGSSTSTSYVTASKGWAGASHWRYRAVPHSSSGPVEDSQDGDTQSITGKKKRSGASRRRNVEPLDFVALMSDDANASVPTFELLPRQQGGGISRSGCSQRRAARAPAKTLLPEDFHYAAECLARYALRPRTVVKLPGARGTDGASGISRGNDGGMMNEVDDFDDLCNDFGGADIDNDEEQYGDAYGCMPDEWSAAFGGFNDPTEADVSSGDALALVAAARQVERVDINYCKAAKQVDVKALKELMWTCMQEVMQGTARGGRSDGEPIDLSEILACVPADNNAGNLEDLSVHLCFICILHLANEHGLVVRGVPELNRMLIHDIPEL